MRGVTFGTKHSYSDWGLMLKKTPIISAPQPKTHYVDIPGMDGRLDLATMLTGKVQYKNRTIEMEFVSMAGRAEWPAIYTDILNALHGKETEIRLDDDPLHSYKGRVTVGDPERVNNTVTLTMSAEVEPYKKAIDGSVTL